MSKDAPDTYLPTLLEDLNADVSDALDHLEAGRLRDVQTCLKGMADAIREALAPILDAEDNEPPT
jgi:hypothetical protein